MQDISYSVRRSQRARRVRVTVDPARGVQVVLPAAAFARGAKGPEREAAAAISELRPWIERRVRELTQTRATVAARGEAVPYLGELLALRAEPRRSRVTRRGSELVVPCGDARIPALERWYRRAAHEEIAPRLQRACSLAGTSYSGLTIRGQRTRWASCSRTGAMSFNWRLLMAPEAVLDYVVWHEVCHLEIADHSHRFWTLLAERCPDFRQHAHWLRVNGGTLVL
ncbi:MAG: M48 family metallopeptidase [Actinomycetota bacterium]|nr:M48 family metallopeptidase [Actinomycetota bacterium]